VTNDRLGVLDIGSNTVHLLVFDTVRGTMPVPSVSDRSVVRLMRYVDPGGLITPAGVDALSSAVSAAMARSAKAKVDELLVMVTSAIRDAGNGEQVLEHLRGLIGRDVQVLSGPDEARLTFLAARRWYGWAAGRLLVLDIGGGSLEVATGVDEEPELAVSLPLGAARLTHDHLPDDPPTRQQVERLVQVVDEALHPLVGRMAQLPSPDRVVATSKTFRSLARLAGMRTDAGRTEPRWRMSAEQLSDWVPRLLRIPAEQRIELPGITPERTYQIVAGAVVADRVLDRLGVETVEICPWALREGALLRHLDGAATA
jgi:exopolyphosphatase/guanosine-5'-triphosphate,3'-diphosphate pyrophosphatase